MDLPRRSELPNPVSNSPRWESLDVIRGLTVAAMLLVNNPGTWDAVYPPLRHAPWHGWTPTDLIFPFFLFIVGVSTELSLLKRAESGATDPELRRRIATRGAMIVLAGLLLHAFPFVPLSRITEIRIPGVLQRIGVCYAVAGLLAWRRSDRFVGLGVAALLLGYWAVLALVAPPGVATPTLDIPDQTFAAFVDRWLLGGHLWKTTMTWDPEGILSTVPAVGTTLIGVLAGRAVRRRSDPRAQQRWLLVAGTIGVITGLLWSTVFPINKNLWTSSYVVFTAGAASLVLALAGRLGDVRGVGAWSRPFTTFGRNALVAFLGSGIMARAMGSLITVQGSDGPIPLQRHLFERFFAGWLAPANASLAFAVAFVALWYAVLKGFEKKGWYLKL